MLDRVILYDMIYALAARNGREAALFGSSGPVAREAFAHSLAGEGFPELWFEVPLTGAPWFDFHALASRKDLDPAAEFAPERCGGNPQAFAWFAAQDDRVRQLALSWDTGSGDAENPAVQLLMSTRDVQATCDFLAAAGRPDAAAAYRTFSDRLPQEWFACYTGVFPSRPGHNLRVECIPDHSLQHAYAENIDLLEKHLRQVGLGENAADLGDTLLERCQMLARTPFNLEFQFDVEENGCAGTTFGASVRFASANQAGAWRPFDPDAEAGELMRQLGEWGLVDDRWRLLDEAAYAKRVSRQGESVLVYCYPAFVKLRWRDGAPLDAKAYLIAGIQ